MVSLMWPQLPVSNIKQQGDSDKRKKKYKAGQRPKKQTEKRHGVCLVEPGVKTQKKAEQRLREFPEEEDQLTQLGEPRSDRMVLETLDRRNWTLGLLDERMGDEPARYASAPVMSPHTTTLK